MVLSVPLPPKRANRTTINKIAPIKYIHGNELPLEPSLTFKSTFASTAFSCANANTFIKANVNAIIIFFITACFLQLCRNPAINFSYGESTCTRNTVYSILNKTAENCISQRICSLFSIFTCILGYFQTPIKTSFCNQSPTAT